MALPPMRTRSSDISASQTDYCPAKQLAGLDQVAPTGALAWNPDVPGCSGRLAGLRTQGDSLAGARREKHARFRALCRLPAVAGHRFASEINLRPD